MNKEIYKIAESLVLASKRAYNRGIQTGSGGNVSARVPNTEYMLVKASGGSLGDCEPEDFLITNFDGDLIEGSGKPTREALLHGYIYKIRPEINSVIHVHAPYTISFSFFNKELPRVTWHSQLKWSIDIPILDIPAAMVRLEDLPIVEKLFLEKSNIPAFILAKHGIVSMDVNPILAEHTAELVEETAQIAFMTKLYEKIN